MKMTKKIMSLAIVFAMVMAMSVSALAVSVTGTAGTGEISISNPVLGQTYTLYQIFDATLANIDTEGNAANVSYTIDTTDVWYAAVEAEVAKTTGAIFAWEQADSDTYYVTVANEQVDGEDIVKWAKAALTNASYNITTPIETITATNDGEVKWTGLAYGYYFVDSSLGALCSIDTTMPKVSIQDKNSLPELAKAVEEDFTNIYGETATANIGQTVNFKLTVTAGTQSEAEGDYVITDTLPTGFTFVNMTSATTTVSGTTNEVSVNVSQSGQTVTFTIPEVVVETLANDQTVEIIYTATMNEKAEVGSAGNQNTAYLTYHGYNTVTVDAVVYTWNFDLNKTDGTTTLTGAEFELYDAATGGNKINLVYDEDMAAYRPAMATETEYDVIVAGDVDIKGLDADTYYLEEIKAPAGYNILAERVAVKITEAGAVQMEDNNNEFADVDQVEIVNQSGTELPSTGGIGTTIFYALGGLMAVGAGVLLVAKKRMEA